MVNPDASWEKLVASQPSPSRELFDSLFAAGDREAIILASLPLIRKANKRTPQHLREDVELFTIGEITREVGRLLQHPNENAGSYLIDCIKHAIHKARFGTGKKARDCVSTNQRIYRPRPEASDPERDKLVEKLKQQGCSEAMIRAELDSRGLDQSQIVTTETEWPMSESKRLGPVLADFGATTSGHRRNGKAMNARISRNADDDWHTLAEVCDESEMTLLGLLAQGHTHDEAAQELGCHVSTVTKWLAAIRARVRDHND